MPALIFARPSKEKPEGSLAMKKLAAVALTAASVLTLSAAANAGDMYQSGAGSKEIPYIGVNWSGFYIGGNEGYGFGKGGSVHALHKMDVGIPADSVPFTDAKTFLTEGAFGGGQLGFNWQQGRLVYGIEADIQGANLGGATDAQVTNNIAPSYGASAHARSTLQWFETFRGRLGVSLLDGKALIYATGGAAIGTVQDKMDWANDNFSAHTKGRIDSVGVATGYTVGGGFEYMFMPQWSLKVEYTFLDLGKKTLSQDSGSIRFPAGTMHASTAASFNHQYDTVRAGINYHVGGAYEPLK
jgi:outer membrane immunogenic protein